MRPPGASRAPLHTRTLLAHHSHAGAPPGAPAFAASRVSASSQARYGSLPTMGTHSGSASSRAETAARAFDVVFTATELSAPTCARRRASGRLAPCSLCRARPREDRRACRRAALLRAGDKPRAGEGFGERGRVVSGRDDALPVARSCRIVGCVGDDHRHVVVVRRTHHLASEGGALEQHAAHARADRSPRPRPGGQPRMKHPYRSTDAAPRRFAQSRPTNNRTVCARGTVTPTRPVNPTERRRSSPQPQVSPS